MKLIKIAHDHYIIVDESKQPVEGYYYDNFIKDIRNTRGAEYGQTDHCWQITHSTQPLDERGYWGKVMPLTLTISEIKELIGEVDVFTVVEQWSKSKEKFVYQYWNKPSFIEGYNQALKDNKDRKYTEEDMKVAITQAFLSGVERLEDFERVQEMILDNIKPKTEWEVKFIDGKLKLK